MAHVTGIDSNILIYSLLENHAYHNKSIVPFKRASEGKEVVAISLIVLVEAYHVLVHRYGQNVEEVLKRLVKIIDSPYVLFLELKNNTFTGFMLLVSKYSFLGGRDALISANLLEHNISKIYSYDKAFDQIKEIERMAPAV